VEDYNTCNSCHDPHTLAIKVEECQACHTDVAGVEDLVNIRMAGSEADYDGDGDVEEGVMSELMGIQEKLYAAIQAYASEVAGAGIVYDAHSYPYFFIDGDGDDAVTEGEASFGNRYATWTPRLLKAAYNYQVSQKDPGEFAHNGKYIIQLMFDSIEDLNAALPTPVDMAAMHRIDPGHFAGSQEAFRHWDEDGEVSASCAKCHSADGLPQLIAEGVITSAEISNGFKCTTCHTDLQTFERHQVEEVTFPSGATVSMTNPDSNLCIQCHQGRAWSGSIDTAIEGLEPDVVPEKALRFTNVHYFAAGATLFGNDVKGAYQNPDNEYLGRFAHVGGMDNCTDCHNTHELEVKTETCFTCHAGKEIVQDIRMSTVDYDGDGDAAEGIYGEIDTLRDALYAAILDYSTNIAGTPVVYAVHSYPYFFADSDGNGEASAEEANYGNRYAAWTPNLLKAAYNYQYVMKDPGAFAHNGKYIIQVLYDSLVTLGADTAGMTRP